MRNAAGEPLFFHFYQDCYGNWWPDTTRTHTTPDPHSYTDTRLFYPVSSNYVDDRTTFSDVRSTKIFTTEGGMPYRLVIRGFTQAVDNTCPATPPENAEVINEFITEENAVTYGCLYASWEQERPMVLEKEAQKAPSETAAAIPTFTYSQTPQVYGWQTTIGLQPTGYNTALACPPTPRWTRLATR